MKSNPQISILVATCNRPKMLKACIQSLLAQQTAIHYEIIVLDQSDSVSLNTLPLDSKIKLIHCDFKNKSRALNQGVILAASNYIAIIDDDCIADENWIANLNTSLRNEGRTSIVTGRVLASRIEKGSILSRLHDSSTERVTFKKKWITPIFKLSGCNFGFHKNLYEIIGAFNENLGPGSSFKSSDDNEWSYRAVNLGFPIIYMPEVLVQHRSWRNIQEDSRLMRDYGYATGAFFKIILWNSKLDFLYHSIQLHLWLLKNVFFSFNTREIGIHMLYGLFFYKGFLRYSFRKISSLDYLFVLSPGKYVGGAERYTQNIATELKKQGKEFVIAVSHNNEFYLECQKSFPSIYLGDSLKDASLRLKYLLQNRKIGAVISNGYHSSYLVILARFRNLSSKGATFIDIKHGWITTNFSERFKTFLDRIFSILYNTVIIVDPKMKRKLWFINHKKITFIPSGISLKNNTINRHNGTDCLRILLVGRLSEEKCFQLVLEALSRVQNNLWELTVVGAGVWLDLLKEIAIKNNIDRKVDFVGYQENVLSFYQNADLLIISSVNEGCPLVALEAMASDALVLSTRVGYMPTMLNEGRGFLVDVNITATGLANKIKEIISLDKNIKNEILRKARAFVEKNHNLSQNAKIIDDLAIRLRSL